MFLRIVGDLATVDAIPRWVVMWALAISIFAAVKLAVWLSRSVVASSPWRNVGFLFAWPGMDVDRFLAETHPGVRRPAVSEWLFAATKSIAGMALLAAAGDPAIDTDLLAGWMGMFGIVFSMHFGLFHVLSLCWRSWNIQAEPIMDWPIASQSLSEFWGRRWNRAFRDASHRLLFRPMSRRIGATRALLGTFLISGLVHDLVISMPVNAGFGGPTLYFVIQGVGLLTERTRTARHYGLGRGLIGRLYCAAFLLLPLPLLFHESFVCNVIAPFVRALRYA